MARDSGELGKGSSFVVLASICIVVAALYFAQVVLIPLALAILFSFLLKPVVGWVQRLRVGRSAATVIVVILALGMFSGLGYVVAKQFVGMFNDLPRYKDDIQTKLGGLRGKVEWVSRAIGRLEDLGRVVEKPPESVSRTTRDGVTQRTFSLPGRYAPPAPVTPPTTQSGTPSNPLYVREVAPASTQIEAVASYVSRFIDPLLTSGLVLVFTIFMLINREDLRERLIHLLGHGRLDVTTQALDEAGERISRFLLAQAVVNIGYGLAVTGGLWLIGHTLGRGAGGFPNVVLWGLLCAVLRFVPYVGIWIAAAMPLFVAFALPGLGVFIGTATMFGVYEVVVSQFVEPYLYGSSTGMSALAILVSAVFWTWLWGPIGLLLSTPLTVCLVVVGKYVPSLRFLDVLLGDEPVLEPPVRIYQRLLALDDEEATELARSYLREMSLERVFDEVLLPALAQAERDRHQGKLDESRHRFARDTLRSMVEELGETVRSEQIQAAAAKTVADAKEGTDGSIPAAPSVRRSVLPQGCVVKVVLLPAKDEADEIAALMLAQVLGLDGYCTFNASPTALAAEMMEQVEQTKANIVVVSALPPAATTHGRYLCKRLQERHGEVPTIIGLWTITGDLKRAKGRLACDATVRVVTTISAAREQIEQFAHPLIVQSASQPDAELATVK